jgi:hypothetical protein
MAPAEGRLGGLLFAGFQWFSIVRRKDEAQYGEYRTKRMVLEKYEELTDVAGGTGENK